MLDSVPEVIALTGGVFAGIFIVGSVTIILFLRRRHRLIIERHGLDVDPPRLTERNSFMVGNEAARRSIGLPYGMTASGWNTLPAHDTASPAASVAMFHPHMSPIIEEKRRTKRRSFSKQSFSIPKTRRQRKIDRAIPLSHMTRSPLSDITENTGSNADVASPALGITELPTEITPRQTPERNAKTETRTSIAWPLPVLKRRSQDHNTSIPERLAAAEQADVSDDAITPPKASLFPRSISMSSQMSAAPDEPLPPLPTIQPTSKTPKRENSVSRYSGISSTTIGTSVLGGRSTPRLRLVGNDHALPGPGSSPNPPLSPSIDVHQKGLNAYDKAQAEPSILSYGSPAKRLTPTARDSTAKMGSIHGSIDSSSLLKSVLASAQSVSGRDNSDDGQDRLSWASSGSNTTSKTTDKRRIQRQSVNNKRKMLERHSMFESSPNVSSSQIPFTADRSGSTTPRPISVDAATIIAEYFPNSKRSSVSSIISNSGSQIRGHKRQSCVRMSNLPTGDNSRHNSKLRLPLMTEEEERPGTAVSISPTSSPEKAERTVAQKPKVAPSYAVFENKPTLEPTSGRRPCLERGATQISEKADIQGEVDIFDTEILPVYRMPEGKTIFTQRGSAGDKDRDRDQSKERLVRLNSASREPLLKRMSSRETDRDSSHRSYEDSVGESERPVTPLPAAKHFRNEPFDPESPMLPSPTISAANLFARKFQSRYAKKSAGGPNGPRAQALAPDDCDQSVSTSRSGSPPPDRTLRSTKTTSTVTSDASSGQDLRKSAMMLRRMNSELRDQRSLGPSYRSYRNIGDEHSTTTTPSMANLSTHPTPNFGSDKHGETNHEPGSVASIRMKMKSPSTFDMCGPGMTEGRDNYLRPEDVPRPLNTSRSRHNVRGVRPSPSVVSMAGQSDMWEDASVKSDNEDVISSRREYGLHSDSKNYVLDSSFESFAGACDVTERPRPPSRGKTKTPNHVPKISQRVDKENYQVSGGYESFAGVCEVMDPWPAAVPRSKGSFRHEAKTRHPDKENLVIEGGFESFAGACEVTDTQQQQQPAVTSRGGERTPKDRKRHGGTGYGLGLMGLGLSAWGTPASLYDQEGFLKE